MNPLMTVGTPAQVLLVQACLAANQAVYANTLGQQHVDAVEDALGVARFEAVAKDDRDTLAILATFDDPENGLIKVLRTWAGERGSKGAE